MNWLSKTIDRIGKSSEEYFVSFRPIELKVSVFEEGTQFRLIFKRGNKRNETEKYMPTPSKHGGNMQTIEFKNELPYCDKSGFYKEKDGNFQYKEGRIKIVNFFPSAPDVAVKICSVRFDLA